MKQINFKTLNDIAFIVIIASALIFVLNMFAFKPLNPISTGELFLFGMINFFSGATISFGIVIRIIVFVFGRYLNFVMGAFK